MIKIGLKNIEISLIIGFNKERNHTQKVYIDIFCTIEDEILEDNLEKTFDYKKLAEIVEKMPEKEIYTIEGLAVKILEEVKKMREFQKVEVRVRKHPEDIGIKLDYAEAQVEG